MLQFLASFRAAGSNVILVSGADPSRLRALVCKQLRLEPSTKLRREPDGAKSTSAQSALVADDALSFSLSLPSALFSSRNSRSSLAVSSRRTHCS
jgi:hypothetical protein